MPYHSTVIAVVQKCAISARHNVLVNCTTATDSIVINILITLCTYLCAQCFVFGHINLYVGLHDQKTGCLGSYQSEIPFYASSTATD